MEQDKINNGSNGEHNRLKLVYGVMAALTAILLVAAFAAAPERLMPEINKSYMVIFEALPVVAVSILVATVITAFFSPHFIARWAGESSGLIGIFIATGAGTLVSCEPMLGLPMILGIARRGASFGFVVALLTSSKLFSFMRIPDYFVFLNFKLAIFFLCSTLVMPVLSGVLANLVVSNFPIGDRAAFVKERTEE